MSNSDIEELIEKLGEEWVAVYTVYTPEWEDDPVFGDAVYEVRNKTDEGLPVKGEDKEFTGSTLREALEKAAEAEGIE